MNATIVNIEDYPNVATVTLHLDGDGPNELITVQLNKSATIFKRWKHLLVLERRIGGVVLALHERAVDLRMSLVHSIDVHISTEIPTGVPGVPPPIPHVAKSENKGAQIRAMWIGPAGNSNLWLQIENYQDRQRDENTAWWNSRHMATVFGDVDEFKSACERHQLDPKEYKLFSPKKEKPIDKPAPNAREARDAAITQVSNNNEAWMDQCLKSMPRIRASLPMEFTGEDVRKAFEKEGRFPEHPNAWGALMNTASKRRIIEKTGNYTQMKMEQSHARETALWRFVA
jgi:hypothetical protein